MFSFQAPIVSQPPPKQVKPNANQHSNTNHGKRPTKKSGSVSGGTSTTYNRPPPPLPPPPPPPFPLVGMYGNLVPAVLESPQPPFKGNNWSPRLVDPSLNRNPRRNNYGPRPINNGYGGRRDHHGSRSPAPRDVHMQHQMGPPPPPPVRPFMRPPFMPPPLRPYGAPMGYGKLLFDHFFKFYWITLCKWETKLIAFVCRDGPIVCICSYTT